MRDQFTICALFYGDHARLAERCLGSIRARIPADQLQLRLGLNEVSAASRVVIRKLIADIEAKVYESDENLHKYPMMRWMFNDTEAPITTPYIIWFDDDSYLTPDAVKDGPWLEKLLGVMDPADMVGSLYTQRWQGRQREWVKAQPWYGGKPPEGRLKAKFATGGWWCARTAVLRGLGYPWAELDHRGGDVMLGEAMFQQGRRLRQFRAGVAINADEHGRESAAEKRGHDSPPIGHDFDPACVPAATRPPVVPVSRPLPPIIEL